VSALSLFTLEKRRRLLKDTFPRFWLASLALLAGLLAACGSQPPAIQGTFTPTPDKPINPTAIFTATETTSPVSSLDLKVQELFNQQHVEYSIGNNGSFNIDLYDSPQKEAIELANFSRVDTQDGLNPNILTAVDKENNNYAYNPNEGWFHVSDVQATLEKLDQYTEVNEDFFTDGRANIVTALQYVENPTISPDAITPHYWINHSWFKNVLYVGLHPGADLGGAQQIWPDLANSSYYTEGTKPFAFAGFYKVHVNNEEIVYINARTQKNPTENNPDQLINLFYGFDQLGYEDWATRITGDGRTVLRTWFDAINRGGGDWNIILDQPQQLPDGTSIDYDPANAVIDAGPNPVVASLNERGETLSLFSIEDQEIILRTLLNGIHARKTNQYVEGSPFTAPLNCLPSELSKTILHTTFTQ